MLKMEMVTENQRRVLSLLFWAWGWVTGARPWGPRVGNPALDYGKEADPVPPHPHPGPHFDFPKHKRPRPPWKLPGLVRASGKLRSGAQPGCQKVSQVDDSGGLERRRNAQGVR